MKWGHDAKTTQKHSLTKIIILVVTAFAAGGFTRYGWEVFQSRESGIGGEIFILPLFGLLLWFGWTARKIYEQAKEVKK